MLPISAIWLVGGLVGPQWPPGGKRILGDHRVFYPEHKLEKETTGLLLSFQLQGYRVSSPHHLSDDPTRQGQSQALKASPIPNALMTLDRHQILAISKQNLEAPIPGPLGNTPLPPLALLSCFSLIANNPQLSEFLALRSLPPS